MAAAGLGRALRRGCWSWLEPAVSSTGQPQGPLCPGFSQDRVSFHQNPGRGTTGWADPTPTWPNRAGYSIPCAVMLGSGGGGAARRELARGSRACGAGPVRENGSVGSCGLFCVFPLSVSLLLLFPLFVALLNCPYPDPPVFCLFLSILLCTAVGGVAAAWSFCCRRQPKPKLFNWRPSMGSG